MRPAGIKYEFTETVWKHAGPGGWHFISLPAELSKEIREHLKWQEEGWGRLKATGRLGNSEWETAIWFDGKKNTYLLPVKGEIRKLETVKEGDLQQVVVWV